MEIKYPFTNYLIFPKVMEDEEICRGILQLVFPGKVIGEIRFAKKDSAKNRKIDITSEKTISVRPNLRGVRMDVHMDSDSEWCNVEMQTYEDADLPKRMRLYQAEGDINSLKPGAEIGDLKRSFIVFICTYDPFGEGQAVYRFRYREEEKRHLILEDETYKIILNTKCGDDKIPIELKNLFGYINGLEIKNEDPLIERIHRKVEELNEGEWGHTMTTVGEYWDRQIKIAVEEAAAKTAVEVSVEKQKEIAGNMKRKDLPVDLIAEVTGLSEEEVRKL